MIGRMGWERRGDMKRAGSGGSGPGGERGTGVRTGCRASRRYRPGRPERAQRQRPSPCRAGRQPAAGKEGRRVGASYKFAVPEHHRKNTRDQTGPLLLSRGCAEAIRAIATGQLIRLSARRPGACVVQVVNPEHLGVGQPGKDGEEALKPGEERGVVEGPFARGVDVPGSARGARREVEGAERDFQEDFQEEVWRRSRHDSFSWRENNGRRSCTEDDTPFADRKTGRDGKPVPVYLRRRNEGTQCFELEIKSCGLPRVVSRGIAPRSRLIDMMERGGS